VEGCRTLAKTLTRPWIVGWRTRLLSTTYCQSSRLTKSADVLGQYAAMTTHARSAAAQASWLGRGGFEIGTLRLGAGMAAWAARRAASIDRHHGKLYERGDSPTIAGSCEYSCAMTTAFCRRAFWRCTTRWRMITRWMWSRRRRCSRRQPMR